jgi:hypothetical protein
MTSIDYGAGAAFLLLSAAWVHSGDPTSGGVPFLVGAAVMLAVLALLQLATPNDDDKAGHP